MLTKMSFKSLVSAVSEQCHEIKQSLSLFPYFDTWDENLIAECCRLGSIVEFPSDKIILGRGTGNPHAVYFILDGICHMVQCLLVQVRVNSYKKVIYKLYRPAGSELITRNTGAVSETNSPRQNLENKSKFEENRGQKSGEDEQVNVELPKLDPEPATKKRGEGNSTRAEGPMLYSPDHHLKVLEECRRKRKETMMVAEKGRVPDKPEHVRRFFVQTGVLIKGACFGLEKDTKDTFIMSGSKVKCLRIPRRFLLQHSPCNIWNRILLFHRLYLPTDEEILKRFVSERNWIKKKRQLTKEIVALKKIPNYTLSADVPYSLRLAEIAEKI